MTLPLWCQTIGFLKSLKRPNLRHYTWVGIGDHLSISPAKLESIRGLSTPNVEPPESVNRVRSVEGRKGNNAV